MYVAVAGNPNTGKTTLFNALTGSRAHVGNYPGVTVERREAMLRGSRNTTIRVLDLPGTYSLIARSPEEDIAQHAITGHNGDRCPDLVICVVDATNLARSLYLVLQLADLNIPVIVALNMSDLADAQGIHIDRLALQERLGMPVVQTSARSGRGLPELVDLLAAEATKASIRKGHIHSAALAEQLGERDWDVVRAMQEALPTGQASIGSALFWLTSDLSEVDADRLPIACQEKMKALRQRLDPYGNGVFSRRVIAARYRQVDAILKGAVDTQAQTIPKRTEQVDRILLHPLWGSAIFLLTMFVLFQTVFAWADPLIGAVEAGMGVVAAGLESVIPEGLTRSLLVHGLLAGVGNVLVFLPQIALLFLGLTLLEESGYLARAAFLMDRLMRRVGLHGKAFVPLMSSFACAVPGVMAARTVESRRDRLVTIMVAPFMSCSARLPVYTLIIGAVFATAKPIAGIFSVPGLVMLSMYTLGFVAAIFTAWLLKRSVLKAPSPPLILEMPTYKWPAAREVWRRVRERCAVFVRQTGTVIVSLSVILWALLTFPQLDLTSPDSTYQQERSAIVAASTTAEARDNALAALEQAYEGRQLEHSIGGRMGRFIEPAIEPLGFDWRIGIGLIASFAAREVLVSTLGQVYALGADVESDSLALRDALLADKDPNTGLPRFSPAVGLSLMVFFVLAMQCLSTVAAVRRETNSWRWPIAQLIYMNALAYVLSWGVYQVGRIWWA